MSRHRRPSAGPNGPARFDPGDPALPVAGTGTLSGVRRSTRGRWRALVLLGVHLLVAVHATHFLLRGRTLSPVEPSESMYTLELGQVNAGFVFFAVSLALTLVFGRFFCGWGCHLVALQDLCGWIMKKLGVRPRPFRTRILSWAPMVLALYMFVWPTLKRVLGIGTATAFPGFSNHLLTDGFWTTFPGPVFAVLTLATCGFAAVYFLGAKGFCTYGCPYGAFYGLMDRLSPGRIVVNDDCEQCGHCTVTCTSNVRVHDEVARHGMVVDPGCMKCMDCVSVCPNHALRFELTRPPLFRRATAPPRRAPAGASLGLGEELVASLVFFGATWTFRGLYDGPPLLMAIGLGAITTFLAMKLWRLARRPDVRLQSIVLRRAGRWRAAGAAWAVLTAVWLVFTLHSGFVQWHRQQGQRLLDRTEATRSEVLSGAHTRRVYSRAHREAADRSLRHFELADRWGLVGVVEVKLGLAWGYLLESRTDEAVIALRRAIALAPRRVDLIGDWLDLSLARERFDDAIEAKRLQIAAGADTPADRFMLGGLLVQVGRLDEAAEVYREMIDAGGDGLEARYNLGGVLRRAGRPQEAVDQLAVAREMAPGDFDTRVELGLSLVDAGRPDEGLAELRRAVALRPDHPESRNVLRGLIERIESEHPGLGTQSVR